MNYYNSFHVISENSEKRCISRPYNSYDEALKGLEHIRKIDAQYNQSFQYSICQVIKP